MAEPALATRPYPYPDTPEKKEDLRTQQEFMYLTEQIRPSSVHEMPSLGNLVDLELETTVGLGNILRGEGPRLFVTEHFNEATGISTSPDRVEFTPLPLHRIGRDDSRRQVMFGEYTGEYFHARKSQTIEVAAKKIPEIHLDMMLHEVAMYQFLGRLGLPTMEVLGLLMSGKDTGNVGFALTKFVPKHTTIDNNDWTVENEAEEGVDAMVNTAARLHENLVFHGDLEAKNVAIEGRIVDLEYGCIGVGMDQRLESTTKKVTRRMSGDLSSIAMSLDKFYFVGDRKPANDADRFEMYHNRVYEPYFEHLLQSESAHLRLLTQAYARVLEQKHQQALGNW